MRRLIANVAKKLVLANRQERKLVANGDQVRAYALGAIRLARGLFHWPTGMSHAVSMASTKRRPRTALRLGLLGSTRPQADQPCGSLAGASRRPDIS